MATIDAIDKPRRKTWTVADLYRRFGPIPFERIRHNPPPGCGTIDDVVRLNDHEDRLYELVDGILVEKTVGYEESFIACEILLLLKLFVDRQKVGLVAGEGGMLKLDIDLVRIPDVSFVSWDRVPGRKFPDEQVPPLVPDLAVEVISPSNTPKEMDEKLREYFEKGVRLVWFVRPKSRVVEVYTSPDYFTRLTALAQLDGGDVLPGFSVKVGKLFQKPKAPEGGDGKSKKTAAGAVFEGLRTRCILPGVRTDHAKNDARVSPGDL